jgi:FAD/FMN-containing dehydrogenase
MSKVAAYLQEHILGEVTTNPAVLDAMSRDGSVLQMTPEMVIYPRVTNDIRKVARFAWQLAEKGHVLPITVRGAGSDATGAAIGQGIVLVTPAHMNRIFEFDSKQKLVRLQPGTSGSAVNEALFLQGVGVPILSDSSQYTTVGGTIATDSTGPLSGKYGTIGSWIDQLEVVLANGDVLQTGRLNKRDLNKKKGLQTFEGEIYRQIDNLIEDNKQLIAEKIASNVRDNVGYSSIVEVKRKDGSFDLLPLIVGSQGTLGIISEMIMKTEFMSAHTSVAAIAFGSREAARDALDHLRSVESAFLDSFDGALFDLAKEQGKVYSFYKAASEGKPVASVVLIGFDDFNERVRSKKLKKVVKLLQNVDADIATADGEDAEELLVMREVTSFLLRPNTKGYSAPPLFDGVYIPPERSEDFAAAVLALAEKHHVELPLHSRVLENLYYTRPVLQLHKVGDKQKIFKLLEEYTKMVDAHGGHLVGEGGEGRIKARFAQAYIDDDVKELFTSIKNTFDPYGILNPGVKQTTEIRQLVAQLRPDHDTAHLAGFSPYN